jgi:hypothetical protein
MARAVLGQVRQAQRVLRRPNHTFQLKHRPYIIQPFLLAPVLPGETMKNLLLQSRVVSDPVKNPLAGWWLEYYIFYVKHRDLTDRAEFVEMMLDPEWTASANGMVTASADVLTYFAGNGINWTQKCLVEIVNWYFRDQGQVYSDHLIDTQPIASIQGNTWLDSVLAATVVENDDIALVDAATSDVLYTSEVDKYMRQYELLRMRNLTTQTYEEFLETYGVRQQRAEDPHKPELLRYLREWTYPTNTVNPSTGTPTTALSWAVAERADKDRYFAEPGFIFGVTCCRPKVYMRNQIGSAAWFMNDAYSWLPAVMRDDPMTSVVKVSGSVVSPLTIASADFYVDVRDLLVYGDQFVNFSMADDTSDQSVPLPTAALEKRFIATDTDIDNLFVDDDSGDSGAHNIRQDGIVSLTIAGTQRDMTPTATTVL